MSSDTFLSRLPSTEKENDSFIKVKEAIPSVAFNPSHATLHVAFPKAPPDDPSISYITPTPLRRSSEEVVAVYRQHFVVHGPVCGPEMQCALRERQSPEVTRQSVGLPRCHVVKSSRDPVAYNLEELWARRLGKGPLVGAGDRVWLEGVGEVRLGEPRDVAVSPYWKFFSAMTLNFKIVELAVEWEHVRLTEEEYECRAGSSYTCRGVRPAVAREDSFLDFGEDGWVQGVVGFWRGFWSWFIAIRLHRVVDSAV